MGTGQAESLPRTQIGTPTMKISFEPVGNGNDIFDFDKIKSDRYNRREVLDIPFSVVMVIETGKAVSSHQVYIEGELTYSRLDNGSWVNNSIIEEFHPGLEITDIHDDKWDQYDEPQRSKLITLFDGTFDQHPADKKLSELRKEEIKKQIAKIDEQAAALYSQAESLKGEL